MKNEFIEFKSQMLTRQMVKGLKDKNVFSFYPFIFLSFYLLSLNFQLSAFLYAADTDIKINEVMANPTGSASAIPGDRSNEFIELYNKGTQSVNVLGWTIADESTVDKIEGWNVSVSTHGNLTDTDVSNSTGNTVIPAGGFAVILDGTYNDSANNQPYNFPAGTIILRPADGVLLNRTSSSGGLSDEALALFNANCSTVSTYGTPAATTPGVCAKVTDIADDFPQTSTEGLSWERVDPTGFDVVTNWKKSVDTSGSTSGKQNSVFGTGCSAGSGSIEGFITEVAPSLSSTVGGDFIEIFITDSSNLCGAKLFESGTLIKTFPSITAKSGPFGAFIVFHAGTAVSSTNPDETDSTGDSDADGVIDLFSDESSPSITGSSADNLTLKNSDGHVVDFTSWALPTSSDYSTTLQTQYETAVSTGRWSPSCTSGDTNCYLTGSISWTNKSSESMARKIAGDGSPQSSIPPSSGDWLIGTPTSGRGYGGAIQPQGKILEVFQSPFSPFGDGRFSEAVIGYKIPSESIVTIQIYNNHGRLVRTLLDTVTSKTAETQTVTWNGKDVDGQNVSIGIYIVHIEAQKPDGSVEKDSKTVIVGRKL